MSQYIIENNGPLNGTISISGAKNSVLGLIAATILSDEDIELTNVPNVSDVHNLLETMKILGTKYKFDTKKHILLINNSNINPSIKLDFDSVKKIRASYYLLGALLGRFKQAAISLPGGCNIGSRPIDLHLKGFEKLGANIKLDKGIIYAQANQLIGNFIYLDFPSVGATINIILASVLANGITTILNVAKEPHILDLIELLNKMGAKITLKENDIVINGVSKLHSTSHKVIPDQIETGTFLIAGAITKGNITLENVNPIDLKCITAKLIEMGCSINSFNNLITIDARNIILNPTNITTGPYPSFPTDMQPQFATLLGIANGVSVLNDNIFENRFCYIDELTRMGANMKLYGTTNVIKGVKQYKGAKVSSHDLRAGAALVLAGLSANGTTIVENVHFIKRGYENFVEKLTQLKAKIKEIKD